MPQIITFTVVQLVWTNQTIEPIAEWQMNIEWKFNES